MFAGKKPIRKRPKLARKQPIAPRDVDVFALIVFRRKAIRAQIEKLQIEYEELWVAERVLNRFKTVNYTGPAHYPVPAIIYKFWS